MMADATPPAKSAGNAAARTKCQEGVGGATDNREEAAADGTEPARRYPGRERNRPADWWMGVGMPTANLATVDDVKEPASYQEALTSEHASEWRAAMDEEMASLHANKTWELEELPDGVKTIPVKWVYKLKRSTTGDVERFKARLVAKGC